MTSSVRWCVGAVQNVVAGGGAQVGDVVGPDAFVAALLVGKLAAGEAADGGDLGDQEAIGAEGFGGDIFRVDAQAIDGRADQDDAGDADDDAEQGEETAQFMGADGVEGQRNGRKDVGKRIHASAFSSLAGIREGRVGDFGGRLEGFGGALPFGAG